jgi:hypothetical protein
MPQFGDPQSRTNSPEPQRFGTAQLPSPASQNYNIDTKRSPSPPLLQTMQKAPALIIRSRPGSAKHPPISAAATGSPMKQSQNQASPEVLARTINGTAVTPGKVRPKSASAGNTNTGPISIENGKLRDIEDIPTIFVQDMDRFMALISCRTDRERTKFTTSVASALRPKSARVREIAGILKWCRIFNQSGFISFSLWFYQIKFAHNPKILASRSVPQF